MKWIHFATVAALSVAVNSIFAQSSRLKNSAVGIFVGPQDSWAVVGEGSDFLTLRLENTADEFKHFDALLDWDSNASVFRVETSQPCNHPGCYSLNKVKVTLDPSMRLLEVTYDGVHTQKDSGQDRKFSGKLTLVRLYRGKVSREPYFPTSLSAPMARKALYQDIQVSARSLAKGQVSIATSLSETTFMVRGYVWKHDRLEALYVETLFEVTTGQESPQPASCLSIVALHKVAFTRCSLGRLPKSYFFH